MFPKDPGERDGRVELEEGRGRRKGKGLPRDDVRVNGEGRGRMWDPLVKTVGRPD